MNDFAKKDTSGVLRLFVYGTLKRGYHNNAVFCGGALSVEDAVVLGRLYESQSEIPVLEVDEQDILAHGTRRHLADVAAQGRFPAELGLGLEPVPESPTAGVCRPVFGELIAFGDPETRLRAIDRLEGFRPGRTSLYSRVLLPVYLKERVVAAWAYVGDAGASGMKPLPRGIWPQEPGEHDGNTRANRFNLYQS